MTMPLPLAWLRYQPGPFITFLWQGLINWSPKRLTYTQHSTGRYINCTGNNGKTQTQLSISWHRKTNEWLRARRPKWLFHSDFPSCSESAEIWHVYSFCVKKCPCVFHFLKNAETPGQICVKYNPPPPPPLCPSPNNVEFRSLRTKTLCMCLLHYLEGDWGGGGCEKGRGGELSRMCLKPCFLACGKKTQGHFFNTKKVDMPNFWATWKIATK